MTQPSQVSLTLPLQFEDDPIREVTPPERQVRLAFSLDHRAWLSLLAEEWWPIKKESGWVRIGIGQPVQAPVHENRIEVTAWLDPKILPATGNALFWRGDKWVTHSFSAFDAEDEQFIWLGPVPLFAITSFSVTSGEQKEQLLGFAQGFSNLRIPKQEIRVEQTVGIPPLPMDRRHPASLQPPDHWNSLRGAAAMAFWAVPRVTPWVGLLAKWVEGSLASPFTYAPWLTSVPWTLPLSPISSSVKSRDMCLWRAMLDVFMRCNIRESWNPSELLEGICDKARAFGALPDSLDALLLETSAILEDKCTISLDHGLQDPLGMVLQMVLLRPKPEHYISWKSDLITAPPAVWWSGAILSGLIMGYRNLDVRFRGEESTNTLAALSIWQFTNRKKKKSLPWARARKNTVVETASAQITLSVQGDTLLRRPLSDRGQWYVADYENPTVQERAKEIAQKYCPDAISTQTLLTDTTIRFSGSGKLSLNSKDKKLVTVGEVLLDTDNLKVISRLNSDVFKHWLVSGSIAEKLGPPIIKKAQETAAHDTPVAPIGLTVISDFLTSDEEARLVQTVDSASWLTDLRRRVQHYGWKYDYSSRSIKPSSYLGELPDWAEELAVRLVERGFMIEKPDQVIVNEYLKNQGISKHIDCPSCFRGPIVTISLIESWSMTFKRQKEKYEVLLPRRSLACLDGPARHEWTHEIAQRKMEGKQLRDRRISLTFRKVND